MNGTSSQCYMCDKPATSKEHVPPKCIFPEPKDCNGDNLRDQLITVPSCDDHNTMKSKDDEFLMASLAGILGNNTIGYRHNLTKVNRAVENSSGRLIDSVFLARKHYTVTTESKAVLQVVSGKPNYHRLVDCFDRIARGIFRHHFGNRFQGQTTVFLGPLRYSDRDSANLSQFINHRANIEFNGSERFGRNPSVFYYQLTKPDQSGLLLLRMCFYEGVKIYATFAPEGQAIQPDLTSQMIAGGMKVIIELEGVSYEINRDCPK